MTVLLTLVIFVVFVAPVLLTVVIFAVFVAPVLLTVVKLLLTVVREAVTGRLVNKDPSPTKRP